MQRDEVITASHTPQTVPQHRPVEGAAVTQRNQQVGRPIGGHDDAAE